MVSPLWAARPTNRRLPAVDYRTRLHLPVRWHATERIVVSAGSIFGVRQPVEARWGWRLVETVGGGQRAAFLFLGGIPAHPARHERDAPNLT